MLIIKIMWEVFFDLGKKGAVSWFQNGQFQKVIIYKLSAKTTRSVKLKLLEFQTFLQQNFPEKETITNVGCYQPFGINRKTIINLAMMAGVLVTFFHQSNFIFVNEWVALQNILNKNAIPRRTKKKQLTIQWVQKNFALNKINDDEADAVLGGYEMTMKKKEICNSKS